MWRIAADTGGTFTDCHAIAPDGGESRIKILSTGALRASVVARTAGGDLVLGENWGQPDGFLRGFSVRVAPAALEGPAPPPALIANSETQGPATRITMAAGASGWGNLPIPAIVEITAGEAAPVLGARLLTGTPLDGTFPPLRFRLATTRATNALLERKGSRVAFFITRGFADLLRIGDQRRPHLFALCIEPREVHYEAACEVDERLDAGGGVVRPIDEDDLRASAAECVRRGIRTAAVALLHSDVNPIHEARIRAILLEAGFTHVSLGSELAPFIRIVPRAQGAVANAYLTGPVEQWIRDVQAPLTHAGRPPLFLMTSTGSLETSAEVRPVDLLLSGPAGGVRGALAAARRMGHERIITFDMGGTSTDVARVDGVLPFRFSQTVGGITLLSPAVAVASVAAGGGSVCAWSPAGLTVGPESAGSEPGPACYGKGGPLTITDVNLLLGRFDPARAPIPLDPGAAERRAIELLRIVNENTPRRLTLVEMLRNLLAIAVEHMAAAIRRISVLEGCDPSAYALLAFGGAGPQHACEVAESLGIRTILVPRDAGILSAVGLQQAPVERIAQRQILQPFASWAPRIAALVEELARDAREALRTRDEAPADREIQFRHIAELRLRGQETPLQIEFNPSDDLAGAFASRFQRLFGYPPPESKALELVSVRVVATAPAAELAGPTRRSEARATAPIAHQGPALVQDAFSTLVVAGGWVARSIDGEGWTLERAAAASAAPAAAAHDLMRHRFTGLVEEMGALLRRTALSTNIRERLDFSCALLDREGRLVVSAPHIPVHLGALGVCVREVLRKFPPREGDTVVTNHPAFGGSHLPDVTLITPVFDEQHTHLGFVANRAHHAEIGGVAPGSMPAGARSLPEEGVVIPPRLLCHAGTPDFASVRRLLEEAPHPTRSVEDNLADLHAQLAANRRGAERLREWNRLSPVSPAMAAILAESRHVMRPILQGLPEGEAREALDDGSLIRVRLTREDRAFRIDFSGSAPRHPGNLNATPAIIRSAVLYVLRLAVRMDLPLNEGLLEDVEILLPDDSLLNPRFPGEAALCPAVVGGNVEVSQRVVDTLLKALRLQACSQGTMNNFIFGSPRFGYYETIAGGSGAGPGCHGADAVHSHMTNTAITDIEVIERRYPVRLREFSVRRGSGGDGRWRGGNGTVREIEFLEPLTVSLLTQHRRVAPFGWRAGGDGRPGRQQLLRFDGEAGDLPPIATFEVRAGDRIRLETPGGGGWGHP